MEEEIILVFSDGYQKKVFAPLGIREYKVPVLKTMQWKFSFAKDFNLIEENSFILFKPVGNSKLEDPRIFYEVGG